MLNKCVFEKIVRKPRIYLDNTDWQLGSGEEDTRCTKERDAGTHERLADFRRSSTSADARRVGRWRQEINTVFGADA